MSGYHIEWENGKRNAKQIDNETQTASNFTKNNQHTNQVTCAPAQINKNESTDATVFSQDNQQFTLPKKEKRKFLLRHKIETQTKEQQVRPTFTPEFKKSKSIQVLSHLEEKPETHRLAIASMLLGIISVIGLFGFFVMSIIGYVVVVCALSAILFGSIALIKINNNPGKYKGKWMAYVGLVIGCGLLALLALIAFVAYVIFHTA